MAQQNPFGTSGSGANAFKAAYDRLKSEADLAKKNISQDYSTAYQQLRKQSYGQGLGAAAQTGLSGGQAAGMRQELGAQQMGALSNLYQGQEKALREQKAGEASIYSNAMLEGQQAQQYEREGQQAAYQNEQQAIATLKDKSTTEEEKARLLATLGYAPEQIQNLINANKPGYDWTLAAFRALVPITNFFNIYDFFTGKMFPKKEQPEPETETAPAPDVNFTPTR